MRASSICASAPSCSAVAVAQAMARMSLRSRVSLKAERPDASLSALGTNNLKHAIAAIAAGRRRHAVTTFHGDPIDEPGRLSRIGNGLTPFTSRLTARSVCVSDGLMNASSTARPGRASACGASTIPSWSRARSPRARRKSSRRARR